MHQAIALVIVLSLTFLVNASEAARMSSVGNWGEALGQLVVAPILVFYGVTALVYFATRFFRGQDKVASFSSTRLHYVGMTIVVLSLAGQLGQRANLPPG